jgi:hypothetical protein
MTVWSRNKEDNDKASGSADIGQLLAIAVGTCQEERPVCPRAALAGHCPALAETAELRKLGRWIPPARCTGRPESMGDGCRGTFPTGMRKKRRSVVDQTGNLHPALDLITSKTG